ncbi:MAG: abscisic acid-deficient protein Aba4 family protein [Betaproteobacteria bacterium]
MWPDAVFQAGSALALSGWLLLLSGDRWPSAQQAWAATLVPLLLAAAYAAIFPALYAGAPGGYGSIDALLPLLTADRRIALAAWLHYLAFDLLVGWMIVREARSLGIAAPWRVPALVLTFLFGPAGWLWFRAQVQLRDKTDRSAPT